MYLKMYKSKEMIVSDIIMHIPQHRYRIYKCKMVQQCVRFARYFDKYIDLPGETGNSLISMSITAMF